MPLNIVEVPDLVLIRGSEARTFRRCRQKWHWSYGKQLEPKRKGTALTFGTLVHRALEMYYPPGRDRGDHPATTFERLFVANAEEFDQWDDDGNRVDALELGIAMLKGYVNRWGDDGHIEIISPEQTFQIDVYDKDGTYLVTFVGTFDTIALSHKTGRIFILEHKTAKTMRDVSIISGYGDQGLGYCWAANYWCRHHGLLGDRDTVNGVMYNFLRKGLPDGRPTDALGRALNKPKKADVLELCAQRGIQVVSPRTLDGALDALHKAGVKDKEIYASSPVSKVQPAPLFQRQEILLGERELQMYEKRLRRQAFEMLKVRERRLPIYKNPTQDCSWDCAFAAACEIHEMGGDYRSILDMEFKHWDPYQEHELEAELKS